MRTQKRLVLLASVLALLAVACGSSDENATDATSGPTEATTGQTEATGDTAAPTEATEAPDAGTSDSGPKTLVVAEPFGPKANWSTATDDAFVLAKAGVLEPLLRIGFDGVLEPSLAESWSRVDDLSWDFVLRSGVSFHDGSPLDAAAVVQSLNFVLESATPPRGFKPDLIASVEAIDDSTVRITATAPDAILPQRLIGPSTGVLSLSAYGADGTVDPIRNGTGPFVLVEESEGQWIKLEANRSYWGGEVALDTVEIQFIPDGGVRAGMVRTGEADITRNVPIPSVPLIESSDDAVVDRSDLPRTTTLYTNNVSGPTADLKIRQAISHAIDRDILALAVLEGAAAPGVGPFPAWEAWASPDLTEYPYDVDRAKALLAEAGIGEDGLELRLWTYNSRAELPDLAVAIQAMLKDVGITAEVRVAEYSALIDDVKAGEYDLFLLSRGHLVDVYDPSGFLGADYTCDGSFNLSGYCNADFDAQLASTSAMNDEADRYLVYQDLQERIQVDAVSTFVVYLGQIDAHATRVEGYQIHPLGHYVLTPTLTVSN